MKGDLEINIIWSRKKQDSHLARNETRTDNLRLSATMFATANSIIVHIESNYTVKTLQDATPGWLRHSLWEAATQAL